MVGILLTGLYLLVGLFVGSITVRLMESPYSDGLEYGLGFMACLLWPIVGSCYVLYVGFRLTISFMNPFTATVAKFISEVGE